MTFVPSLAQFGRHATAASYDTATVAWANAVIAAGSTVGTPRKGLVDTLIKSLKANSIWAKLDRLWLFAAENSNAARIDLVALQTATVVNSLPFTADQGYGTPSNTAAYIDSGFAPGGGGTNYTLNSASVGVRSITAIGAGDNLQRFIGNASGAPLNSTRPWGTGDVVTVRINDGTFSSIANATSLGLFAFNRSASNARQVYLSGSSLGSDAVAASGTATGNIAFVGDAGSGNFSALTIASAFIGGSLTATDQANFYTAEHAYMQAIGLGASAP